LGDLLQQARELLPPRIAAARAELVPWENRPVPVQPCLCDVWHDHVLFTGDAVTGLIDYGAMKPDHPAVDLARLLGDLVGDDTVRMRVGLDAYRSAGGPLTIDEAFVTLLDRTGVVCAVLHWLDRLEAAPALPDGAARRLGRLLGRLEKVFPSSGC
jgi:aminoglycoside phosphotransferase (APT) family kinase protein